MSANGFGHGDTDEAQTPSQLLAAALGQHGQLISKLVARQVRARILHDEGILSGLEFGGEIYRLLGLVRHVNSLMQNRINIMPPLGEGPAEPPNG